MGKGDRKSKRGKIHRGTYGRRRPRKVKTAFQSIKEVKPEQKK
jgi:30S ribosomal protein S31